MYDFFDFFGFAPGNQPWVVVVVSVVVVSPVAASVVVVSVVLFSITGSLVTSTVASAVATGASVAWVVVVVRVEHALRPITASIITIASTIIFFMRWYLPNIVVP